eukprot:TRINITY_DN2904_c0_g2_i2.p1 TRINITY_DN2904_c0_g2~~TRINITY_DN2904_c0_g2_i2.p1  ORF type:complete len:533 (-),score=13.88 TRINITY_DN2904_c0_g2_i2:3218-4750(-)
MLFFSLLYLFGRVITFEYCDTAPIIHGTGSQAVVPIGELFSRKYDVIDILPITTQSTATLGIYNLISGGVDIAYSSRKISTNDYQYFGCDSTLVNSVGTVADTCKGVLPTPVKIGSDVIAVISSPDVDLSSISLDDVIAIFQSTNYTFFLPERYSNIYIPWQRFTGLDMDFDSDLVQEFSDQLQLINVMGNSTETIGFVFAGRLLGFNEVNVINIDGISPLDYLNIDNYLFQHILVGSERFVVRDFVQILRLPLRTSQGTAHSTSYELIAASGTALPTKKIMILKHFKAISENTLLSRQRTIYVNYNRQINVNSAVSERSRLHELENLLAHPDAIKRRQEAKLRQQFMKAQQIERLKTEWWMKECGQNLQVVSTPAEFDDCLRCKQQEGNLIVVKFFAPYCHACKTMDPKFRQIVLQNLDVIFIKFNVGPDSMRARAEELKVNRLPYFHIYSGTEHLAAFTANLVTISRLRRAISIYKQGLLNNKYQTSFQTQGLPFPNNSVPLRSVEYL